MRPLRIRLVTPARPGVVSGNQVTASRWAGLLRSLGHRVRVERSYRGAPADLLIALHAHRSHASVARFSRNHPGAPIIVGLAGTDIYAPGGLSPASRRSIDLADRLVVLQPHALRALPRAHRAKAHVIHQSAAAPRAMPRSEGFEVCVIAHLRRVKDPFRAAMASRLLPEESRVTIAHVGSAFTDSMKRRAQAEQARNPRYRWLERRTRAETLRVLLRSRALVLSSWSEGGANVLSEAIAASIPVLASRVQGSVGLLGKSYGGYFRPGDSRDLTALLRRFETEPPFRAKLARQIRKLGPMVAPERERRAWQDLLDEIAPPSVPVRHTTVGETNSPRHPRSRSAPGPPLRTA